MAQATGLMRAGALYASFPLYPQPPERHLAQTKPLVTICSMKSPGSMPWSSRGKLGFSAGSPHSFHSSGKNMLALAASTARGLEGLPKTAVE